MNRCTRRENGDDRKWGWKLVASTPKAEECSKPVALRSTSGGIRGVREQPACFGVFGPAAAIEAWHDRQTVDGGGSREVGLHAEVDQIAAAPRRGESGDDRQGGIGAARRRQHAAKFFPGGHGGGVERVAIAACQAARRIEDAAGGKEILFRDLPIGAGADKMDVGNTL
jgi:hypothetical protein